MYRLATMNNTASPWARVADYLWTVVTLLLALLLAAPAAMVVTAPFMKSQPAFVYDRYGCQVPAIGPERARLAGQCAKDHAAEPAVDLGEPTPAGGSPAE